MIEGTAERIAAAALAILSAEGAEAVTMRRVAARAGLTPMAAYRHYPNREALLRAVAHAGFARVAESWHRREHGDPEARMRAMLNDFLDFALGEPHLYRFLLTDRRDQARRFPDDFHNDESPTFGPIHRAVQDWMRDGLLRTDDPLEVTLVLTASVQGLVLLYLNGRIGLEEDDFRRLCGRTVTRILHGIQS